MEIEDYKKTKLFQMIVEFKERRNNDWREYGAGDTEPRWHFHNAMRGNEIPETARDWEIYYNEKGAGKVAKDMTRHLKRILKEAAVTPIPIKRSIFSYFGIF